MWWVVVTNIRWLPTARGAPSAESRPTREARRDAAVSDAKDAIALGQRVIGQKTLLLVVPPQPQLLAGFSTGLIAIANFLKRSNPSVGIRLLDLGPLHGAELEEVVSRALLESAGRVFVGLTGTTASYQSMLATARMFKKHQPSCVVVAGGHHVTAQDSLVLTRQADAVDFVIRGEGEIALSRLLAEYPDVANVPNLSWLEDGRLRRNAEGPHLQQDDLDSLGPTFGDDEFRSVAGKFGHVTYVSARGCPLSCAFCVVRATRIRAKSITRIVEDIRHLVAGLGHSRLAIEDNFFGHQPRRTLALCEAIKRLRESLDFSWDCQTRVESMRRRDIVSAMAEAGCSAVYLGVESLVPKHLLFLGKTPRPDLYLEDLERIVLPNMLAEGLDAYINLQFGLPGETVGDRESTRMTLTRLGALAAGSGRVVTVFPQLHVIYPGTPHFHQAVAKGAFGPFGDEIFEAFTIWEAREEPILNYLGEHFAHGVGGVPLGLLDGTALAQGRFEVSSPAISIISTDLRRIDGIPGVEVFRYGRFLTGQEAQVCHG